MFSLLYSAIINIVVIRNDASWVVASLLLPFTFPLKGCALYFEYLVHSEHLRVGESGESATRN